MLVNKRKSYSDPHQYFICLMVYSVSLAFLKVPETSSLICSLRLSIAIACWSWSEYISISSISSLFISSYSFIRTSNLSNSPFSFLLSSSPRKCYFLSFYYWAIMMSSWFYSLLMFAQTPAIFAESSFPRAIQLFKLAALAPASALFFSDWFKMLLQVILLSFI